METAKPQAEVKTTPTVKVKYNHEEKEIPIEEAAVLAQKGMNYDKVLSKLQGLESELKGYQEQLGSFKEKETKWAVEDSVRKMVNDGMDEAIAKQLVEAQTRAQFTEQELNQLKAKAAVDNQVKTFVAERPDVDLSQIPQEVIDAAKQSGNLLKEFNAWESSALRAEIANLRKQMGVKQANAENETASMGSVASKGDASPTEINEDVIRKMTSEQRRKQLEDKESPLWKFLHPNKK